ncbi:MAG: O-antigen ligase family protein [Chitinophagaceae bacterium]
MNARATANIFFQVRAWLVAAMTLGVALAVYRGEIFYVAIGPMLLLLFAGLQHINLIYFLLIFCIPFSAELQVTEQLGTDFPDEPLMWLLSVLLILHFILYRKDIGEKKINKWIVRLLLLHLGWILVSSILSQYPLLSIKYLAAKSWYILALALGTWYCLKDRKDVFKLSLILMATMLPVVMLIIFQHAKNGFSFESVNPAVQPFFRNHVNYGAFLVCLIPLPIAGFILSSRFRWIFGVVIIFWLLALFFSYSRGAWMALLAGGVTVLAIRYRCMLWLAGFIFLPLAAAILYLGTANRYLNYRPDFERTIYHQEFKDHLKATYRLTDLSTAERFHRWIGGIRMTEGHYLHGYGPNSFFYEYKPYTVTAFQTYVSTNEEKSTVHNYFLLLLIEQGIPGLLIFCLLTGGLFYYIQKWYESASGRTDRVMAVTVAAILGMIVSLNMLSDLIETDKIGGLFFICVGILCIDKTVFHSVKNGA